MSLFGGGIHVPHKKHTASMPAVPISAPSTIILPMSMHIGKPATPVVKPGDHVCVGTLVAEASGPVSAPIYSSVSGTVKKLDPVRVANGSFCPCIFIESDGLMTKDESIAPPDVHDYQSFIDCVRASGMVGLGGAGFPTAIKLDVKDPAKVSEVIINAAECEPYITSDTRTMLDDTENIVYGIELLKKYLGVKKIIFGIEKNKAEAIEKIRTVFASDSSVTVSVLPSTYPQGAEKVLIKNTTGKIVPGGKLPLDVGSVVINVTTLAAIARYIKTGMPLTEKCVTIDGTAVDKPGNYIIPIGMTVSEIIEKCGIDTEKIGKILSGGPMMGLAIPEPDIAPVQKNTNALIFMDMKEGTQPVATQCIHCGKCATHCPMNLTTFAIARAYEKNDTEELVRLRVDLCVECGCCSYVCPAKRPLVEINKISKGLVREYMALKKQKEAEKK